METKLTKELFDDKKFVPFKKAAGNKFRDALLDIIQLNWPKKIKFVYAQTTSSEGIRIECGSVSLTIAPYGNMNIAVTFRSTPVLVNYRLMFNKFRDSTGYFNAISSCITLVDFLNDSVKEWNKFLRMVKMYTDIDKKFSVLVD